MRCGKLLLYTAASKRTDRAAIHPVYRCILSIGFVFSYFPRFLVRLTFQAFLESVYPTRTFTVRSGTKKCISCLMCLAETLCLLKYHSKRNSIFVLTQIYFFQGDITFLFVALHNVSIL